MAYRGKTARCNWGKVINEGQGGFLNPPGHPEHTQSVKSVFGNTFYMSLSAAADADWLDPSTRGSARGILKRWANKHLPLNAPEVQDWVYHTLGYFKNCYQGDNGTWDAGKITVDNTLDPWLNQDEHCGVHHIRKFYPEYEAKPEHFQAAYWGCK